MSNYERAIWGTAWALLLSGIAVIAILAVHPMGASAAATPPASHTRTMPGWAHWKTAPRGACGHGTGIVVWAGHGDGVLICANGDVETS